jgi:homoserine O-succinyltransferase
MTVILPRDHHVRRTLEQNGVPCITPQAAQRQDIRPLRIGILNIMPRAETYEFNLLLPLGRSILQIDPVWIRLESHVYGSTGEDHLARFYVTFKQAVRDAGLDGLIVTGAPVEEIPFEKVNYWPEVSGILAFAREHISSTLGICWGGLALAKAVGIEKTLYPQKVFGVFKTRNLVSDHPIIGGLDDVFWCPQSRHAGIPDEVLERAAEEGRVRLLAHAERGGYVLFETPDHRFVMHLGHHEYNSQRLLVEAERDREQGRKDVGPLQNLDPDKPVNNWRANRNEFFSAWIRYLYLNMA